MTATMTMKFYTVSEAAKRLGISEKSVRELYKSGLLSYSKITRWYRFSEDDITDYLNRQHHHAAVPTQRHRRERKA